MQSITKFSGLVFSRKLRLFVSSTVELVDNKRFANLSQNSLRSLTVKKALSSMRAVFVTASNSDAFLSTISSSCE